MCASIHSHAWNWILILLLYYSFALSTQSCGPMHSLIIRNCMNIEHFARNGTFSSVLRIHCCYVVFPDDFFPTKFTQKWDSVAAFDQTPWTSSRLNTTCAASYSQPSYTGFVFSNQIRLSVVNWWVMERLILALRMKKYFCSIFTFISSSLGQEISCWS